MLLKIEVAFHVKARFLMSKAVLLCKCPVRCSRLVEYANLVSSPSVIRCNKISVACCAHCVSLLYRVMYFAVLFSFVSISRVIGC